jgi:hypothetical protein
VISEVNVMRPVLKLVPDDDDSIPSSRPSALPPTRREGRGDTAEGVATHISAALLQLVERACLEAK